MSNSATPRRRRRDAEDVNGDDEDLYGSSPKRARRDSDDGGVGDAAVGGGEEEEEGSQSPEQPLLPDSFRRSPKGKQRAVPVGQHQPGAIVRVTLTNFVTYTKAEFQPGPSLNMIIGPNGTGKSTLVCAICLGLGSKPDLLGRAKKVGEFVKHGAKKAEIEIELAADPDKHASNPIITTRIVREGDKREYLIDGKKATGKALEQLTKSFSIQVDNLCQFLPQDRVVEFAALSPIDLLAETQRAAAPPHMAEWHDQLKGKRKEQKLRQSEQQVIIDDLKSKQHRQNQQQEIVERLRERSELQDRAALLERLRPLTEFWQVRKRHGQAKTRRDEAKAELRRLQQRLEPNLRGEEEKQSYLNQVEPVLTLRGKLVDRGERRATEIHGQIAMKDESIKEKETAVTRVKKDVHAARLSLPDKKREKDAIERAMQNPPAEVDFAACNEQIREKTRLVREAQDRQEELRQEVGSLGQLIQQQNNVVTRAEDEKQSLQTQAGQQANKLKRVSNDAAAAWDWIQNHRDRFQGEVFGPPIVECTVKDLRFAGAVETALGNGEMTAFTVTSRQDFTTLSRALYDELKMDNINIRQSERSLAAFKPPATPEQLSSMGLEAWILDLLDGPEPVLAMLCDNRSIHSTAYTGRELNTARLDVLKAAASPITSWMTPTEHYTVTRRREYGDKATSTRAAAIRAAKFFTDAPPSHHEDAELEARAAEAKRAIAEYEGQREALREEHKGLVDRKKKLSEEAGALTAEKRSKQEERSIFAGLPTKLEKVQKGMDTAQEQISSGAAKQWQLIDQSDKLTLEKGQLAIDYANAVSSLRDFIVQHVEAQMLAIEARSDIEQLKLRTVEEKAMIQEREREVQALVNEAKNLLQRGKQLEGICGEIGASLSEAETELATQVKQWEPDALEAEIQSVQARLEMTAGGNQHVLREYEDRAKKIERAREKLAEVEQVLEQLQREIRDVREQWEPQLDHLVAQISDAFANNFSNIQCAGEVSVHKDDEFELWSLQLKVKFRENEQLSILDNHRQSGGERAVSTIFYLMSLQSLARAPFRVVDEINQGMDPRNERLVHSRMVDIACSEDSASQYFLITPKLLQGLKYHPTMKVHCIASGEYMPENYRELDFAALARRALQVRAAAG